MEVWAAKFLMLVYTTLGVLDIPAHKDANWNVVERWVQQPDQSYRLHLESETIPQQCKSSGYVIFPQTYYGSIEIYIDDYLIYTNSTENKWHLLEALSRPVLNCKYFADGKKLIFFVSSRNFYFASINRYPVYVNKYPPSQFIYEQIYFLCGLATLIFGLLGGYFLWKLASEKQAFVFLMYNLGFTGAMYAEMPGAISDIPAATSHTLIFISLNCALIYFMVFSFGEKFLKYLFFINIYFIFIVSLFLIFANGNPDISQAFTVLFLPVANLCTFLLFLYKIKTGSRFDKVLYFTLFIFVAKDSYISQLTRDGFLYLSVILVLATFAGFLRVLEQINKKKNDLEHLSFKLASETKIMQKISMANDMHREVIHDLKSPLSVLDFNLRSVQEGQVISELSHRIKLILNRMESDGLRKNFDWYSQISVKNMIEKVMKEKGINLNNFQNNVNGNEIVDIYFDPLDLEICLSELIDNAVKYGLSTEKIYLYMDSLRDKISISIHNDLQNPVDPQEIGLRGVTTKGSGLGISGVKKKLIDMGGILEVVVKEKTFIAKVMLRKK